MIYKKLILEKLAETNLNKKKLCEMADINYSHFTTKSKDIQYLNTFFKLIDVMGFKIEIIKK